MGKNSGNDDGVCRSLGALHEIGGIKVLIIHKNMFLQFRNAFKESFMDCSPIMSHEQSGKSRHALFNDVTGDSIANNFVIDVYCRRLQILYKLLFSLRSKVISYATQFNLA